MQTRSVYIFHSDAIVRRSWLSIFGHIRRPVLGFGCHAELLTALARTPARILVIQVDVQDERHLAFLRSVRERAGPQIPILAVCDGLTVRSFDIAIEHGADDLVLAGVGRGELVRRVDEWMTKTSFIISRGTEVSTPVGWSLHAAPAPAPAGPAIEKPARSETEDQNALAPALTEARIIRIVRRAFVQAEEMGLNAERADRRYLLGYVVGIVRVWAIHDPRIGLKTCEYASIIFGAATSFPPSEISGMMKGWGQSWGNPLYTAGFMDGQADASAASDLSDSQLDTARLLAFARFSPHTHGHANRQAAAAK